MADEFLYLEVRDDPDRTFVLHTERPRFLMEFVLGKGRDIFQNRSNTRSQSQRPPRRRPGVLRGRGGVAPQAFSLGLSDEYHRVHDC